MYPWSHFLEDLAQNLPPQMPDNEGHNAIVGGALRFPLVSSLSEHGCGSQVAHSLYRLI